MTRAAAGAVGSLVGDALGLSKPAAAGTPENDGEAGPEQKPPASAPKKKKSVQGVLEEGLGDLLKQ